MIGIYGIVLGYTNAAYTSALALGPSMITRVLSGITPSGSLHLGNYVGAVRPALDLCAQPQTQNFFFLADLHSLITAQDPARTHQSSLEIAASWLACGLDVEKAYFYRQSDIPEIPQLMWLLSCIAAKGTLNRAHAYKAAVDKNRAQSLEDDAGISMGLYLYPLLMSADILLFNPHSIPVGRDQVQHVEIARDLAQRFNHVFQEDVFILPEASIDDSAAVLPGLDGRKMSKSYGNTIALFSPEKTLKNLIFSMITDSKEPNAPKQTDNSGLFQLYQAFASPMEMEHMASAYAHGIAWSEVKGAVFEKINATIAPLREAYARYIAHPSHIEMLLRQGAERVRKEHVLERFSHLRQLAGFRDLGACSVHNNAQASKTAAQTPARIKQYRAPDGQFYFKLVASDGRVVLQSGGFAQAHAVGKVIAGLKDATLDEEVLRALCVDGIDMQDVFTALQSIQQITPDA